MRWSSCLLLLAVLAACEDGSGLFTFGPNTDQELWYDFVIAWPAGSLSNGSRGIVGGQNSCFDLL